MPGIPVNVEVDLKRIIWKKEAEEADKNWARWP
jgi:hypothetical protein